MMAAICVHMLDCFLTVLIRLASMSCDDLSYVVLGHVFLVVYSLEIL